MKKSIKIAITALLLLLMFKAHAQDKTITFKHYKSSISYNESDLDNWFNGRINDNGTLANDRKLSYEEYSHFKTSIIEAMKHNSYFEVDNLRYFTLPYTLGGDYYLDKKSDRYKTLLKSAKNVGKKDWFVKTMEIRKVMLSYLTDAIIEDSKSIPK